MATIKQIRYYLCQNCWNTQERYNDYCRVCSSDNLIKWNSVGRPGMSAKPVLLAILLLAIVIGAIYLVYAK